MADFYYHLMKDISRSYVPLPMDAIQIMEDCLDDYDEGWVLTEAFNYKYRGADICGSKSVQWYICWLTEAEELFAVDRTFREADARHKYKSALRGVYDKQLK